MSLNRSSSTLPSNYTICTSSTRPSSPVEGQIIYETDTDKIQFYSGSAWVPYMNLAICTSTTRPGSPTEGMMAYETDSDSNIIYSGSAWMQVGPLGAWASYTPSWTSSGVAPSIGNGSLTGAYMRVGRQITGRWFLTAGSTTTSGTGNMFITLPASLASGQDIVGRGLINDSGTASYEGCVNSAGQIFAWAATGTFTSITAILGTATPNASIANGDFWTMQFQYETT